MTPFSGWSVSALNVAAVEGGRVYNLGLHWKAMPAYEKLGGGIRQRAQLAGLDRYFTGKSCPVGHVCDRRVSNHKCVECYPKLEAEFGSVLRMPVTSVILREGPVRPVMFASDGYVMGHVSSAMAL